MPETYRAYPVFEVALAVASKSSLASGHERVQEGDIVATRREYTGVGLKEAAEFLWLRLTGLDESVVARLTDPSGIEEEEGLYVTFYDKRRYCIPLDRLAEVAPHLDLDSVRDTSQEYQPGLPLDEDDYTYIPGAEQQPLEATGLIYDKDMMRFL